MLPKTLLVGDTGFVGSNLASQYPFTATANSATVATSYGTAPDLCVYAGVRSEKFLANSAPEQDYEQIEAAIENIRRIEARRLVLVSTIDVYHTPLAVNESSPVDTAGLHPYGLHRYRLEEWVASHVPEHLIVRLPALFGKGIKKNFIYDLINVIPALLKEEKYRELAARDILIRDSYVRQDNGFYKMAVSGDVERRRLKSAFEAAGFSALNFTDSRARFQFYHLAYLWKHIQIALAAGLRVLNLATEPLSAAEVYQTVRGTVFCNELSTPPPRYDFRTQHAALFNGSNGYVFNRQQVLADIAAFAGEAECT
jgi:hypothetical protein